MKAPTFAHGTYEKVINAISSGKIKYPVYIWLDDTDQYSFLNKNGELEICGIPKKKGTLDSTLILSELADGLYQISGQYKITTDNETIYSSSIDILAIIQTKDDEKYICTITVDDIITYTVNSESIVTSDSVVTKNYLELKGYASTDYVNSAISVLEEKIKTELYLYIDEELDAKIEQKIDSNVLPVDDSDVRNLFN